MAQDEKTLTELNDEQLRDVEGGGHKIPVIIFGDETAEGAADGLRSTATIASTETSSLFANATVASTEAASLTASTQSSLEENIRIAGR